MKKIVILLTIFCMNILNVFTVIALEEKDILDFSVDEIEEMNDDEYLKYYGNYIVKALDSNKSDSEIQEELSKKGIIYSSVNQINQTRAASSSSDINLKITLSRRSGQSYTYVTGVATSTVELLSPGTEDMMSIEWQPSKGTYYGYTETQNATLNSYKYKNNGLLVFNIQDSKMTSKGQYALCSALVTFNNNSSKGDLGLIYIHTFSDSSSTLTLGGNVQYVSGQVSGGGSISITFKNDNTVWQRAYLYS